MAPEIVKGEKHCGYAADVWAFGIIVYEVITDKMPFAGVSPVAVMQHIVSEDKLPRLPKDKALLYPSQLISLYPHILSQDAESRPLFHEINF